MPGGRTDVNSDHGIEPQEVRGQTLELTEDLDSDPGKLKVYASDLRTLEARMTGRSHDLDGAHNDAAQSFTELFKWPIIAESGVDLDHWAETTRAIFICSALTTELADAIEHYKDERAKIISRWNTEAPNVNDVDVPNQLDDLGLQDPLEDLPTAPTENEALVNLKEELEEEERVLKSTSVDVIDEITDGIRNGESPEVLTRLHEGGYINYGYFNHRGDLEEGVPFDVDHEEIPENVMEYVDGDKEPDDEFYEMVAYLSQIGFKAMGAQNFDDVNMDPEEMQLLKDLFDHIEEEGDLMGIPEDLQGHMSPEDSTALLAALGGGLLTLSDKRLTNGEENVPGGYQALPASFREAVEHEFSYDPSKAGLLHDIHGLLEHSPDLEAGRGLSLTLNFLVSNNIEAFGWEGPENIENEYSLAEGNSDKALEYEKELLDILDISLRNERANADMLNGDGLGSEKDLEEWFANPRGNGDIEEERKEALEALFSHNWSDDGRVLRNLTDWMHENAPEFPKENDLPGDIEVSNDERLAVHGMEGFMRLMHDSDFYEAVSQTGHVIEDPNDPDSVWRDISSAQLNPELADAWSDIFIEYKDNFGSTAGLNGRRPTDGWGWSEEEGLLSIHPTARLHFAQLFMGEENAAKKSFSEVIMNELESMEDYVGSTSGERDSDPVQRAGILRGLLGEALRLEGINRRESHDEHIEYEEKVRNDSIDAVVSLEGRIPSPLVGLFKDYITEKADSDGNDSVMEMTEFDELMMETQLKLVLLSEGVNSNADAQRVVESEFEEIFSGGEFIEDPHQWEILEEYIESRLENATDSIRGHELNGDSIGDIETYYRRNWNDYNNSWRMFGSGEYEDE